MNPLLRLLMQAGIKSSSGYQAARGGSALMRLLGGVLQNRMNTQRNFQQQMRMQSPSYQRGMQNNYMRGYQQFQNGQVDEYGVPKPPKAPKYPM